MTSSETKRQTRLAKAIGWLYGKWAHFVAKYSVLLIVLCSVLSLIGTYKIVTTPNENDIQGWTPYGARARDELAVATEFFNKGGNGVSVFALLLPLNSSNVLEDEILIEAKRVHEILVTNFTMDGENFQQFCYSFCQINDPFLLFVDGFILQNNLSRHGQPLYDRVNLSYPVSNFHDNKLNIQPYFFGVDLYEESEMPLLSTENSTEPISNMRSAKMIALQIRAERQESWSTQDVKDFEMSVTRYFADVYKSPYLRVLTLSTSFVESEVVRAGMSLIPFLGVGFAIMAVVSSVTTVLSALCWRQMSIHKLSLALMACLCPFMACGTALGALFYMGVRFSSVLCVTPFLVLAIGVDDAYLMIHAWQRVTKSRRAQKRIDDSPESRLAEVLADTGPAVMISALTNILADLVGTFTGSPEITLLAYGNMACMFVDFVYQISFYAAVMILAGKFEMEAEQQEAYTQTITCGADEKDSIGSSETKSPETFHQFVKRSFASSLEAYLSLITNKIFDFLVILAWAAYLAISIYGITQMRINLTSKKLFSGDSPLQEMDTLRVEYVIPHFTLATLFVNNPGDLTNDTRRARLHKFVDDMEHIPGAWGAESSNFFLRDFEEYAVAEREELLDYDDESVKNGSLVTGENIARFIEWPEYQYWRGFVRISKNSTDAHLDKFFLTTAYRGEQLKDWMERDVILKRWRSVVDRYAKEFNISVFLDDGVYLDLIDNMPTDMWQSAVATLCTMAAVCAVFLCDATTVAVATAIIASIMTGILGILSLTGTDLDPIMMAALIISIGFSVDIPAHVTYHYHTAEGHDARTRLRHCLSSVGFPAVQASISTSLCVLALLLVPIYMSQVFVKTMILCMTLCVLHSLVLIPCLASLLSRR